MALTTTRKESSFTIAPAGQHGAVCVDIVDRGTVTGQYGSYHGIWIIWLIDKVNEDFGDHYMVMSQYSLELTPKGKLTKLLGSWRGKPLSDEELQGFDVEKLLGVSCVLQVVHRQSGDNTFANIDSIMPHIKGVPLPDTSRFIRHIDRDPGQSKDVRVTGQHGVSAQAKQNAFNGTNGQQPQQQPANSLEPDDDLPF